MVNRKNIRLEIIEPLRQPKELVTYKNSGPGVLDPVKNAENQLQFLQDEFVEWLENDCVELRASWESLRIDPANPEKFLAFHKAVHVIAGNAAILNCPRASSLARPLARMLERGPNIESHIKLVDPAIHAICAAIQSNDSANDALMSEIIECINTIVARWIERRQ